MNNLTPEEREIGKQNFNTAIGTTRRDFLKGSLLAGGAGVAGAGAMYFNYGRSVDRPVRVGIIGTGDEGNVLIGALNPEYIEVAAIADIRPYNVWRAFHGDWSSPSANYARPGLMKVYGWSTQEEAEQNVQVYSENYEQMLEDAQDLGLEGVIIALPLHLHDVAAVKAMRKGLHVLTEKLMGQTVARCKEMSRVSQQTGKLLATGHQRHYSMLYDNAVHTIKQGLLGNIHHIRAQWHRGNLPGNDSWKPPLPPSMSHDAFQQQISDLEKARKQAKGEKALRDQLAADINALREQNELFLKLESWAKKFDSARGVDKELWAKRVEQVEAQIADDVDAEKFGYQAATIGGTYERPAIEELIRWRLWERTGGGLMAELGSHQLDAASIFISSQRDDGEKVLPISVTGVGGRHIFPFDRECDDHVYCLFEFPGNGYYEDFVSGEIADPNKKIVVSYSSINGNGFGGYGEIVLGTKGTLILEREADVLLYAGSATSTKVSVSQGKGGPTLDTTESGGGEAAVAQAALSGPISRGYREEIEHWAWCIRNPGDPDQPNLPRCHPKVAMADAILALTTNQAMATGEKIMFEKDWFDINSDATPEGVAPRKAEEIG